MKNIFSILFLCALGIAAHAQTSDTLKVTKSNLPPIVSFNQPLCFLNGKKFTMDSLNTIKPNLIESIQIVQAHEAKEKYGDAGKNGAVLITLKPAGRKED